MRPHRLASKPTQISQKAARVAFGLWRCNATDAAVLTMTVERLASIYRVPVRELEAGLLAEQDKRRRANA